MILVSGDDLNNKIIGLYKQTSELRRGKPVWKTRVLHGNQWRYKFIFAKASNKWAITDQYDFFRDDYYADSSKSMSISEMDTYSQPCPTGGMYMLFRGDKMGWQSYSKLHVNSYKGKVETMFLMYAI